MISNKNILITGGTGMLGRSLKNKFTNSIFLNGSSDIDLTKRKSLNKISKLPNFDYIIHTAAITDLQENERNPDSAYQLHAGVVSHLQKKCRKFIYISAQGRKYRGVYYKTKYAGEKFTNNRKNDLVIRTNIVGNGGLNKWALSELRNNKKINGYTNVYFNPVHVDQLSKFIYENINLIGKVNFCSFEILSKFDYLRKLSLFNNFSPENVVPIKFKKNMNLTVNENFSNRTFKVNLKLI